MISIGHQWSCGNGAKLTFVSEANQINGHRVAVLNCSICSKDRQLWPAGSIRSKILHMNQGKRPCGCSISPKWSASQQRLRASRVLAEDGYFFVAWENEFKGKDSKLVAHCPKHGSFTLSMGHLMTSGTRCQSCGNLRKSCSENEVMERIHEALSGRDWSFSRFVGGFNGYASRAIFNCDEHGEWEASIDTAYRHRCGCPSCAVTGFQNHKRSVVYALRSDCGGYLKIGISGKPKKRFLKLSRATPFGFDVIRIIRCSGNKAISIESRIHSTFESAGFKGWDGATEWLKYDPSIIDALNIH